MPGPAYRFLEYVFLALLYLFFLRVVRAVWVELREPRLATAAPSEADAAATTTVTPAVANGGRGTRPASGSAAVPRRRGAPTKLALISPGPGHGSAFPLGEELTIGRAEGCAVALADDTFVSQLHARVFLRGGDFWVEDLGSTNGTFLNGRKLAGVQPLHKGDKVQVGRTVLEVQK